MNSTLNDQVRAFWEKEPCGTGRSVTGALELGTREWFEQVERTRYAREPFIHSVAQFTCHNAKRILEVGVGAGTDHLQWARAGCECVGVDLTDAAIEATRRRLELYGFSSTLRRLDAQSLPFADNEFDLVWSWGVIHHAERPERIMAEIHRVLKPGGEFRGMMYKRRSLAVFKEWVKHALLKGRPWQSFADVLWNHFESVGTKAYTDDEMRALLADFGTVSLQTLMTPYDTQFFPNWLSTRFPAHWGSFIAIMATK
jgi:ubiquinone/menaquinone biosynthesis C-methylase UbiE